ncbi:hypothetical protein Tco_1110813 [Tanacetum coccineum]|uniref:Uncharacterized protein n=1 Tax=Tanacetum coccineum TaxID=301880 RepID=A0ABQ5ILD0_9ASTR
MKRKLRAVVEEKDILLKAKGEEVDILKNDKLADQLKRIQPHLLTTIARRRWLLTHGLKLFLTKCLNSSEYLSALGAAISRAIKKGMQDGLAAGIKHGAHGRRLEDLVAYNPSTEEDYSAALQELRSVDFSLLTKLKSHKDASVETIMNLLRLESQLVNAPGMSDLQPNVDQLMVPIHRSEDQAVLGSTSLLFALSVSRDRLSVEPLSMCCFGSTIPPISTDDNEIVHADGQEGTDADGQIRTGADANPFPSTDDAELNVSEDPSIY